MPYQYAIPEYLVDDDSGCWIWQRCLMNQGYGIARSDGRQRLAHRVIYERHRGPIPAGMTLDHTCHNADLSCPGGPSCKHRRCVNPDHLDVVPRSVNAMSGRSPSGANAAKTHCANGHPFDGANTIRRTKYGKNERICRTCVPVLNAQRAARQAERRRQRRKLVMP